MVAFQWLLCSNDCVLVVAWYWTLLWLLCSNGCVPVFTPGGCVLDFVSVYVLW